MKKIAVLFFALATFYETYGQNSADSLSFLKSNYSLPYFATDFSKQLNTYYSNSNLKFKKESSNFFFGFNEHYNTTLIRSSVNHVKSENNFNAMGEFRLSPYLSTGILLNSTIYSNDRKLSINSALVHNASFFTKFNFKNIFKIIPFGGYSLNKQIGELNRGFVYGTEFRLHNFNFASSEFFVSGKFQNEDILPRRNLNRKVLARMENKLNDYSKNLLSFEFGNQRKDFYFAADSALKESFGITNNIQSRNETKYLLKELFDFNYPNSGWAFNFESNILWRDIDRSTRYILIRNINSSSFDSDIKELKMNFGSRVNYSSRNFHGTVRLNYSERNEVHAAKNIAGANQIFYDEREEAEKRKNNKSQLVTLYASMNYNFSDRDRLLVNLFHRKLRYDTPSEENFDDRDELLSLLRLRYERKFSPFFTYFLETEGSFNHIVYIFAERSSNNNIQRVLKLSSGGQYLTRLLKWIASAEVSANYTVYDFEDINPNIKSFVFRQYAMRDSTIFRLNEETDFQLNGYVKLSEQGDFKWNDFKSRPSRYVEEVFVVPEVVWTRRSFSFGSGIRYFSLTTFGYDEAFRLLRLKSYKSIGPLSDIEIRTKKVKLSLYGWYEFVTYEDNSSRELVNLKVSLKWLF